MVAQLVMVPLATLQTVRLPQTVVLGEMAEPEAIDGFLDDAGLVADALRIQPFQPDGEGLRFRSVKIQPGGEGRGLLLKLLRAECGMRAREGQEGGE